MSIKDEYSSLSPELGGSEMELRILGAHNLETINTKHTCFLLDNVLAIDAGSLVSTLDLEEQEGIQGVLITHRHYDHVRDLPSLGLATIENGVSIKVYSLQETLDAVFSRLMNGILYPDLTQRPSKENPKYRLQAIVAGQELDAMGYLVKPILVPHGPPAVGYIVHSPGGACFAYSGDTGGGLLAFFQDPFKPNPLFVEVTFPSGWEERAHQTGHLTPRLLQKELEEALKLNLPIPSLVAVHIGPKHERRIKEELGEIATHLGIDITVARENMVVQI